MEEKTVKGVVTFEIMTDDTIDMSFNGMGEDNGVTRLDLANIHSLLFDYLDYHKVSDISSIEDGVWTVKVVPKPRKERELHLPIKHPVEDKSEIRYDKWLIFNSKEGTFSSREMKEGTTYEEMKSLFPDCRCEPVEKLGFSW